MILFMFQPFASISLLTTWTLCHLEFVNQTFMCIWCTHPKHQLQSTRIGLIVVQMLLIHHERFRVTVFSILENIFVFEHRFLLLLLRLFVKTLIKVLFISKNLLLLGLTLKSRVFYFLFYQWLHFWLRLFLLLTLTVGSLSTLSLLLLFSRDPFDQQLYISSYGSNTLVVLILPCHFPRNKMRQVFSSLFKSASFHILKF
jgi:hypothetical protein